ncbi:hypothetical protein FNU79_10970 [Deinococcus detaillensis]|uniref:NTP pyrophosphohydrolase MazG-like domain-containing protein n=1 Tax=Deinococcus detaillensis TaxID=2592048 RepID=A0A553UWA9_9DEIO|nr:MazG-like family protein [Deinococcus detaillensis]TSA84479.1 hypothetical protein FNU79_10970 [Deinococcus detaillensis]
MDLDALGSSVRQEFGNHLAVGVEIRFQMLVSELGELAKEVIKASAYGTQAFGVTPGFREELGDVLVDLALLSEAANLNLSECADLTLSKMRQRLAEHGRVDSETA